MLEKTSALEALTIINDHNALIKSISSETAWSDLTHQLQDPENFRPAKAVPSGAFRTQYYNPMTNEWLRRKVDPNKGSSKPGATHTKKTAACLLPPEGWMRLQDNAQASGALLLDIRKCYLKQYVFDHEVESDNSWWLYGAQNGNSISEEEGGAPLPRSVTLDALRAQQNLATQNNTTLNYNKLLVGLSKEAVIGIAVLQNNFSERLKAHKQQLKMCLEINKWVPILITSPAGKITEYTAEMQLKDLVQGKRAEESDIAHGLYLDIMALYQDPNLEVLKLARQTINNDDLIKNIGDAMRALDWEAMFSLFQSAAYDTYLLSAEYEHGLTIEKILAQIDFEKIIENITKENVTSQLNSLMKTFYESVNAEQADSTKLLSTVISSFYAQVDFKALSLVLSSTLSQGNDEHNGLYWLMKTLCIAIEKENKKLIKMLATFIEEIASKINDDVFLALLTKKITLSTEEGASAIFWLIQALMISIAKKLTTTQVLMTLITTIIEKATNAHLEYCLTANVNQRANACYMLVASLHSEYFTKNTDWVVTDSLFVIIQKVTQKISFKALVQALNIAPSNKDNTVGGFFLLASIYSRYMTEPLLFFINHSDAVLMVNALGAMHNKTNGFYLLIEGLRRFYVHSDSSSETKYSCNHKILERVIYLLNIFIQNATQATITALNAQKNSTFCLLLDLVRDHLRSEYLCIKDTNPQNFFDNLYKNINTLFCNWIEKSDAKFAKSILYSRSFYAITYLFFYAVYKNRKDIIENSLRTLTLLFSHHCDADFCDFIVFNKQDFSFRCFSKENVNNIYVIAKALNYAVKFKNYDVISHIIYLLADLFQKTNYLSTALFYDVSKLGNDSVWYFLMESLSTACEYNGLKDQIVHFLFELLIKIEECDGKHKDKIFERKSFFKKFLLDYLDKINDVKTIEKITDKNTFLGRLIDYKTLNIRDADFQTNTRMQVLALITARKSAAEELQSIPVAGPQAFFNLPPATETTIPPGAITRQQLA